MNPLTKKQSDVLEFIRSEVREKGRPPTVRELATMFGWRSSKAVTNHLEALASKGYIEISAGVARGLRILAPDEPTGIPILGEAPAGPPVMGYQTMSGYLDTNQLFHGKGLFAVRVRGDSMEGAGILDGDLVVVRSQTEIGDGAIGVAYVDEEVTIKRVCRNGKNYQLVAENPKYAPIDVTEKTPGFRIGGEVIGVVRVM